MELHILKAIFALIVYMLASRPCAGVSPAPQNNYTVTSGGVTCLVMTAVLQLTIPYTGQTQNVTKTVSIPSTAAARGSCSPQTGTDVLNISFHADWLLSITVKNASGSGYQWETVVLHYRNDPNIFNNVSTVAENQVVTVTTALPAGTMLTPGRGSYRCQETILQLNNSISMNVSLLQYRALGTDNSTWFSSTDVHWCSETMTVPDTDVALAVSIGIGLGASMVAALLLFIVGSRVMASKTDYNMR